MTTVVGIDLAAGRGTTEVVALRCSSTREPPRYLQHLRQRTVTDADIAAAVASANPAVIAIDAPLSLPAGVMAALRGAAATSGAGGSPYTRAAEREGVWSTLGVRPLPVSFLGGLTFRAIMLVPRIRSASPGAAIIEVFPTATLAALGLRLPRGRESRPRKTSVAARRSAQRGIAGYIGGVEDPERELASADELDALAAALTAARYLEGAFVAVGDASEGQIVLPYPFIDADATLEN
jgi:predicted nuclease with RNAse H fold